MAKGVQLPGPGDEVAQVGAVSRLDALAGRDDDIGLGALQLVHLGQEFFRVKGDFRQEDEIRAVTVLAAGQTGRTGQPARVAAHDLGHRHAADVVNRGITDDLLEDGGNVLGGRAVARRVVCQAEVVVDGLGDPDEPDAAAHLGSVAGKLCNGVHGVVAANVEHRADVVFVKQGKQFDERGGIRLRVRQLETAAAQIAGGGALEQLNAHAVVQQDVQLQQLFLEQSLNAVLHTVDGIRAQAAGRLVHARQTGIDDGRGAAALADDDVLGHENLLLTDPKKISTSAAAFRAAPAWCAIRPALRVAAGMVNQRLQVVQKW